MEKKAESEERREYLKTVGALVAGLAIGGAVGWLSKPAERVTETVPGPTVTKTVPGPTVTVTGTAPPVPVFYGWMGKVLDVDLTTGTIKSRDLDEVCPDYKDYVGGRGLGVRILYNEVPPEVGGLDPENVIVFATGPLTGAAPSSGRYCLVSKSPLAGPKVEAVPGKAGAIFDSQSGGLWGPMLRHAGFDAMIIRGRAETLKYLWVHEGEAELRDATALTGKKTFETTADIKGELGEPRAKVACIGPAGENLVRTACVISDADKPGYGRACGRDGGGAIMGSKNLKAIAVYGTEEIRIADPEVFADVDRRCDELIREGLFTGAVLPMHGTITLVDFINGAGAYPTHNFKWGMFDKADMTNAATLEANQLDYPMPCAPGLCDIRCGRASSIKTGKWEGTSGEGPEYETTWSLGAQCGVSDLNAITKAHYLGNELGFDPISAGSTIGCAMELSEIGAIAETISWGDGDKLVELMEATAYKTGIGADLAEGAKRLAAKYGHPELFMGVKGLEFPAYDPRGVKGHGLGYATSNRGACHLRSYMIAPEIFGVPWDFTGARRFDTDGEKIDALLTMQHLTAAIDSLLVCLFSSFSLGAEQYAELLSAATGEAYTAADLLKIGERIWNLEKLFNIREGFTEADDHLPPRLETEEPMPDKSGPTGQLDNPSAGQLCEIPEMLPTYYSKRGWNAEGVPTDEKLEELGLGWAK